MAQLKRHKDTLYSQQFKSGFLSFLVLVLTLSFPSCRAASCSEFAPPWNSNTCPQSLFLCASVFLQSEGGHPVWVLFHRSGTQFTSAGRKCQLSTFFHIQCKLLSVGFRDRGREATISATEVVLLEDERRWWFGGFFNRTAFKLISSIFPSLPSYHCDALSFFSHRLSFVGFLSLTTGTQQNLNTQFDEQQLIMRGSNQMKKKNYFLSVFCRPQSAFSVPPPHAILSLFPPLSCLTCRLTPPPSLLFSLSGWYVPWTKSTDGERAKRSRGQEVTKKGGGGAVSFPSTCALLSVLSSCAVGLHWKCSTEEMCCSCK